MGIHPTLDANKSFSLQFFNFGTNSIKRKHMLMNKDNNFGLNLKLLTLMERRFLNRNRNENKKYFYN